MSDQEQKKEATERLPIQMKADLRRGFWGKKLGASEDRKGTIPRIVGEAAWQGYAADGHGSQSCKTLHERGGFGLSELGYYLARAVDEGRVEMRIVRPHPASALTPSASDSPEGEEQ